MTSRSLRPAARVAGQSRASRASTRTRTAGSTARKQVPPAASPSARNAAARRSRAAPLLHSPHRCSRPRVAPPALSKQIRDLEAELGVALFERLSRGVRLTRAGEAFLTEARNTLDGAVRAIASARGASESRATTLHFAHGELSLYAATIESLLATFRAAYPEVHVRVSSQTDGESYRALRDRTVDVAW